MYDYLSGKTPHPNRGMWNDSGFTVTNEKDLWVASDGKNAELASRAVDKNAIPCMVAVIGTSEVNSMCWQSLKKQLETNNIKFLISMQDKQAELEDSGEYFGMTAEQLAEYLAPYGQTELLIQEAVNLSAEFRNGLVRLTEPRSGYKDRAVVLAYANYVAEKIDTKYSQSLQNDNDDYSDIQLVF